MSESDSATHSPWYGRRSAWIALVAALSALIATMIIATTGPESDQNKPGSATQRESQQPETTVASKAPGANKGTQAPTQAAAVKDAIDALEQFLKITDTVLGAVDGDLRDAHKVATGGALGELEASLQEFEANEWRQEGAVTLVSHRAAESNLDKKTASVTFEACIDSSGVRLVDKAGKPVTADVPGRPTKIAHLYTLHFVDGDWKVALHSFPRVAEC